MTTASTPPSSQPQAVPPHERVSIKEKAAYGVGGVAGGLQNSENFVMNPIFVVMMGISPTIMSICMMIYRVWDGITDMLMGWQSDRTRGRWGRRKPYIFIGAILGCLWLPVLFFVNPNWSIPVIVAWMVSVRLVTFLFDTIWNIPYQCLLLEASPNSVERTNLAAWRGYVSKLAGLGMTWIWFLIQLPIFHNIHGEVDLLNGARWVYASLGLLMLFTGLAPLFVKERVEPTARQKSGPQRSLLSNLKLTFTSRPFVILIIFSLLLMMSTNLKQGLEFFTRLNYVFQGDQQLAAKVTGIGGTLGGIIGIAGIPIFQWIANHHGKILAVKIIMGIGFFASLSTLVFYTPANPYLSLIPGLLLAPCMTAVWVLIPSMTGDVADHDELRSGERREGSFAATYSWTLKLSISMAILLSGPLVELAGYDASLKEAVQSEETIQNMRILLAIIPALVSAAGIWMIHKYPLTTAKIAEVKSELDRRRSADCQL